MDIVDISVEEMEARTARYGKMTPSKQAFVDTRIPEYARDIFNVIGRGVTEDPNLAPAITVRDISASPMLARSPERAPHCMPMRPSRCSLP